MTVVIVRAALAVGVTVAVAACGFLPPTVDCGPLDAATCQQWVAQLVAEGQRGQPAKRLVRITFTDDRGSYTAEYDDGTGAALIVD